MIACATLLVSCGSNAPKMIVPEKGQNEIRMNVGDTLRLEGTSHSSVGLSSIVHFNSKGFSMEQETIYQNPEN